MLRKQRQAKVAWEAAALLLLLAVGVAQAQFIAFNDHAPGTIGVTTSSNATTWNIMGNAPGASGPLRDISTGSNLPVTVTITRSGTVHGSTAAANPSPGTPLYNTFNGYVDFQGAGNSDAAVQVTGTATVTYTFSGLKTNRSYSFKGGAVRGGSGGTYPQRWSLFEIDGASFFTSAHTAGCFTNGLATNQVAINTGVNSSGEMADWEDIVPGTNGSFAVTTTQYTNTIPGGGTANGPYCYALSGLRIQENDPPAIVSAASVGDNDMQVIFSIPVSATTATTLTNYSLTNLSGNVPILGAAFVNDNKTIQLTTAAQTPYSPHWLTVNSIADAGASQSIIATNSQASFTNVPFTAGYIQRQLYFNVSNGTSVATLTSSPKFPNQPDQVDYPSSMGWPVEDIADNYGGRFSGFLVPPLTGNYYFTIRSDDASQLLLSPNNDPAYATVITAEPGCCESFDAHSVGPILLSAGQRYYIEALMKENLGSDYLYVAWKTPTNCSWAVIPGSCLGNYLAVTNSTVTIVRQPADTTGMADYPAAFSVVAGGNSVATTNVSYQWQCNGFDIAGATAASYTTMPLQASDNGSVYRVLVAVPGQARFSSNAVLAVVPDTISPTVIRAFNLGPTNIQLVFSKRVEAASATNWLNYEISSGVSVTSAALDSSNTNVTLSTGPPLLYGSNYSITINNVRDQATAPNTIAANTLVSFPAMPYAPQDIGNPAIASTVTLVSNGVDVVAAGSDIGGMADQFDFNYQFRSGDFDVICCVAGLTPSDLWSKAGLMARETLDPASRFAATLATPGLNGCYFAWRDPAFSTVATTGSFPANFPYTWLRLKRAGNLFTGWASYDGRTWTTLGSASISMPSQIYFGLVVSSHIPSQTTAAQFRDVADVGSNAVSSVIVSPHEPLGPCSRKTGIVISEIMWKPALRTDGNNLEFVEIYNSNPWFHDLSGYQLTCADMNYTFPPGTVLQGGDYLVIAASPQSIQDVYGITNVAGPYSGSLKRSESLELLDEQGAVLLTVPYSDDYPWPVATDGTGHSLVLANPSYGEGDPRAWDISDVAGGSPGMMECYRPSPLRSVVINEILPHSEDLAIPQFVELYNHSTQSVDVSSCILTDDPSTNKYVIAPGTVIGPAGFVSFNQAQLGFALNGAGGTLYFIKPDGSRVLDAVQFTAQSDGVSYGRWPDGANDFYALQARTPGTNNSAILIGDIVVNELMYKPISGDDDAQYIELYNKGTNTISLANWQFTAGVTFTFPPNAALAPNSYLVVARNLTNLLSLYTNLSTSNTLGNYSGKLSHNGERVALAMPQSFYGSNTILVVEDEVTYSTGGRWGQWAAGGGSSLELIDPRSNHRLAANWGDSDETHKSSWVNIENTGVLDNGANYDPSIDYAQIGLLDVGECLVDNIEVHPGSADANYVLNADFENGLTNWTCQGDHIRSSLENEGYNSAHSLHLRCSDRIWPGDNSCEAALATNTLAAGQTATLRFKARWLRGWPEVLLRLNGNWLEATGPLPVPASLGTPGARNSRYVANAGPAIYQVMHAPTIPGNNQAVVVTARVYGADGVQSLVLHYRLDPSTNYTTVPMKDDGTDGDAIAGDGLFSATIPAPNSNAIVAFYLSATDPLGTATRFPALLHNNYPTPPECVVMFGDSNPGGSFPVYHAWITQTNATLWSQSSDLSNETWDWTVVINSRVIYNAQGRFAGSPYHQGFNTPYGNACHYKWVFPDDDAFLGATSFNKLHDPGNGAGDDASLQREACANTFLRALGVPWLYRHLVAVYVNGNRRGVLMEDAQTPDSDIVKEHFPNDTDGWLYKMQPWFEFGPAPKGSTISFARNGWCDLMPYTTTGGVKKAARYRYNFESRRTPDSASNFTNVFSLVDAASSFGTPNYVANMENLADMENWMRVFAANHAAGNWDAYGCPNAQNLYGYIGALGTKYSLLMFDFNIVLGNSGSWYPGENLFAVNSEDPNTANIYNCPTFRRMYWRALQELVNGPLDVANSGPLLDAKYNSIIANGLSAEDPNTNIKPWLSQAASSIAAQLAAVNTTNFTITATTVSNNVGFISGLAPLAINTLTFNGIPWPVTWTSVTNWTAIVPLRTGNNPFTVLGIDRHGQQVPGANASIAVTCNATVPSPIGQVVINEIMYHPLLPGAEFVELYNNSTTTTFDLSGWELTGPGYTFPPGSIIRTNSYLVLAANGAGFAAAYGATNPVFDTFSGLLQPGQLLELIQPGSNGSSNTLVAGVQFDNELPWPTNADGTGSSLQLIDPGQDNWRVGNWAVNTSPSLAASPDRTNTVAATLIPFPPLWLNEVEPNNLTGITNGASQRTAWLELYNASTQSVSLAGLYLADNYTNLTQWPFPNNAQIGPSQFLVVFADGLTNLSTTNELHTSFVVAANSGSVALTRLTTNGQMQVLDYLNYANLLPNYSYGSFPDGQSFVRQVFFQPTPGGANNGTSLPPPSFIPYLTAGAVYTQNFDSLPNPGSTSVNSANPVTIDGITYSLSNPYDFAFPVSVSGNNGGLGLASLAGWYGLADPTASVGTRFGATDGDQTTGGQISFGLPDSSNRALGLLATSTTGYTAFGAKFINGTSQSLKFMKLQVTGEVWRQSNLAKTLEFCYFIDPSATNVLSTSATAFLPALNVGFPTVPADVGGAAVDGTAAINQTNLGVFNQVITNWEPGAALWLVWEMVSPAGKSQGLAIDNLSFSASSQPTLVPVPLVLQPSGNNLIFSWPTYPAQFYQIEYKNALSDPLWIPLSIPFSGTGNQVRLTNQLGSSPTRFFRLRILATDAEMPSAPPSLAARIIGGQFTLTWPTLAGQTYQVQYKDNLTTDTWTALGHSLAGTGDLLTLTNNLPLSAQRLFRVWILP